MSPEPTESAINNYGRLSLKKIFGLSSIYGISPIMDKALALFLLPVFKHYLL